MSRYDKIKYIMKVAFMDLYDRTTITYDRTTITYDRTTIAHDRTTLAHLTQ